MVNDDIAKRRAEAAALLNLDADNMSPADVLRVDLVSTLRSVIDDEQAKSAASSSADLARLITAVDALAKMLPARTLEEQPSRITGESARQKLLEVVLAVIAAEDAEAAARASEMETIASEMERDPAVLRRLESERVITPSLGDIVPPGEQGQLHVGPVVGPDDHKARPKPIIDAKPNPPPSAPRYELVPREEPWREWVRPDGSIRTSRWSS
jgi:hypothetical protein